MADEVKAIMQGLDGIIESAKKREHITYLKQLIDEMRSSGYNKVADLLAEDLAEIRAQIILADEFFDNELAEEKENERRDLP